MSFRPIQDPENRPIALVSAPNMQENDPSSLRVGHNPSQVLQKGAIKTIPPLTKTPLRTDFNSEWHTPKVAAPQITNDTRMQAELHWGTGA